MVKAEYGHRWSSMKSMMPDRIAQVDFHLIDAESVLEFICRWRRTDQQGTISLVNPHSVMLCRRDPEMKDAILRSALVLPDGIGIILGASLMSYAHHGRLSGPELMLSICDMGRRYGLTHHFCGGEPGVAEKVAKNLAARYPGLRVLGCSTPPFSESTQEDASIVSAINAQRPDILWVGLGAPKQEKWIARHAEGIAATALIGIGAAFDFHSGNRPWCPAPLRRLGLEWAYRLACEPRRLIHRNIDSFRFLGLVARQLLAGPDERRARPQRAGAVRQIASHWR